MIKKAGCILLNKKNKTIALVCRKGKYSFPKGHLEDNETLMECAIREAEEEETGHCCHLFDKRVREILHYKNARDEKVECYFYLAIDDGITTNRIIDEKDKEQSIWKEFNQVENLLEFDVLKNFWKKIKKELDMIIDKEEFLER